MSLPTAVYCRPGAYDAFAKALSELETTQGLLRAAFAISLHDRPAGQLATVETSIQSLAGLVRQRVRTPHPQAALAHLHDVLFDVVGLRGNTEDYYRPANSYLGDVLQTGLGIPISLVLVYKVVAEPLELTVHGINAPGHFLAGVEHGSRLMYVDPFYGGDRLDDHDVRRRITQTTGRPLPTGRLVLQRATHRMWISRMLNNLQTVFAATGRERDLFAMQELHQLLSQ